jgi:hypothetical protein
VHTFILFKKVLPRNLQQRQLIAAPQLHQDSQKQSQQARIYQRQRREVPYTLANLYQSWLYSSTRSVVVVPLTVVNHSATYSIFGIWQSSGSNPNSEAGSFLL